jgi:hypothetical protein
MNNIIKSHFQNFKSKDRNIRHEAYINLMMITDEKVDWTYDVWDYLIESLNSKDNHERSASAQFIANLARSDYDKRIINDFPKLWQVTKDPKFVTARHSLKSIWKVGLSGEEQRNIVINHFINRFKTCTNEKNHTLIRADIIEGLKNLYTNLEEEEIKKVALELIELEEDIKYRKKYSKILSNK